MILSSERYSRQMLLSEIGAAGQRKINNSKVAIIGCGALGSVSAELLVRIGIGSITLIDRDVIEESNLPRQHLFLEEDIGKSKAETARKKLREINHFPKINSQSIDLNSSNIGLLKGYDLILDCTDNLQTRFLINDFCRKEKIPWIYAAVIRTSGYVMPIFPEGPCFRCFVKEAHLKSGLETCNTVGVLNTIVNCIAAQQATIAIKILFGKNVEKVLSYYNIWTNELKKIIVRKRNCATCRGVFSYLKENHKKIDSLKTVIKFCSSGRYQIKGPEQDFKLIKKKWKKMDCVIDDGITLQFKNIMLFKDGRALIKAGSEKEARAVYSKYIL